jgi:hypothetical protein
MKKATLELVLKRDQIGMASRELDQLGQKGEQSAKRIEAAFSSTDRAAMKLADSMRRMRETSQSNAMASMISATDPFQRQAKSLAEATGAADKHHLALGRINMALEGLAVEAVGANSKLASIGGKFLEFGVGGVVTGGVLGGLAAITFAWDKLTESARKAQEELKKQLDLLRDIKREQDLGIEGETGAAVKGGRARLEALASIINHDQGLITGGQLQGQSLGFVMAARDRAIKEYIEIAVVVEAGEKRLTEIREEEAERRRLKAEQAIQKEKSEWEKFFAELARVREVMRDQTTSVGESIDKKVTLADIKPRAMLTTGGLSDLRIPANVIASAAAVQARAAGKLDDAADRLRRAAEDQQKAALKTIALNSGLSLLGNIGAAGGALSGVFGAAVSGAAGGPWGVAIAGVSAFASAVLGSGRAAREAAAQVAQMRASIDANILGLKAQIGLPGAREAQIRAEFDARRRELEAAYPEKYKGVVNTHDRGEEYRQKARELDLLEKQVLAVDGLRQKITDLTSVIDNLRSFQDSIKLSNLSPLTPVQQFAEARRQYEEIVGKARGGDLTAAGQLPEFARQYLESARSVYASGYKYQQTYSQVLKDTNDIAKLFEAQRTIAQQSLDVLLGIKTVTAVAATQAHDDSVSVRETLQDLVDAVKQMSEENNVGDVYAI